MKSIYQLTVLLAILFVLSSGSCRKGGQCEQPNNVALASEVLVTFKDGGTGKYLYEESFPLYNKDSLKVFDENGNSLIILSKKNRDPITAVFYWDLSFGNIYNSQTDAASFNAELCRNFVVKYKHNETDTIRVCFKTKKTECGSEFDPIKAFHKGQLLGTEYGTVYLLVTVTKN